MKGMLLAAGMVCGLWLFAAPSAAFDYAQSVDEISLSPTTAYNTVYLGMPRSDFKANFSAVPGWTFYGSDTEQTERAERFSKTILEGIEIFTADASPSSKILAFDNYFKTPERGAAREIYKRLLATIYSSMDDFPIQQRRDAVVWKKNDVTVVVSFNGQRDEDGLYTVTIRRYNNYVLNE